MLDNCERLLKIPAAAEVLNLRPKTLRAWMAARRIGYIRVGGAIRIPASEVQRIIAEGKVPARQHGDR